MSRRHRKLLVLERELPEDENPIRNVAPLTATPRDNEEWLLPCSVFFPAMGESTGGLDCRVYGGLRKSLMVKVRKIVQRLLSTVLVLSMGAACWTCADLPARVRKHTYPPDFNYITTQQLHSTMWKLAERVERLNHILRLSSPVTERERAEIVQLLTDMERVTDDLRGQGWSSNHPEVDFNLDRFQRDVAMARLSVESDPPSYFLAGSVSGACLYCHDRSR